MEYFLHLKSLSDCSIEAFSKKCISRRVRRDYWEVCGNVCRFGVGQKGRWREAADRHDAKVALIYRSRENFDQRCSRAGWCGSEGVSSWSGLRKWDSDHDVLPLREHRSLG